jgi:hypothetical protein
MGNLRFFAIIDGLGETASLHAIPDTISWRAFRLRKSGLILIEWLKRPNPNNLPRSHVAFPSKPTFNRRPSGASFESGFGSRAKGLDELYQELQQKRRAGTIPLVALHTALLLNRLTSRPVLSVASDDDDWDFVCEARDGVIHRVRFLCGNAEIWIGTDGKVERLEVSSESHELHRIARHEIIDWSDELSTLFGFDGDAGGLDIMEVDRCEPTQSQTNLDATKKPPFWRLW